MANKSISQLTSGGAIASTDLFPDVQTAGVGPVKVTALQLGTYVLTGVFDTGFTFNTTTKSLTLGVQSTTAGSLVLANANASAYATTVKSSDSASAAWTLTLPVSAGTNGYLLTTNGSGVTAWTNPTALGIDLDIGTTAITSGTVGRLLFEGAGNVLQESANLTFSTAALTLGVQQTTQGSLVLANTAVGAFTTTLQSSNSSTAAWTMTLPPAAPAGNAYVLTSTTGGVTSWTNPTSLGIDLDVGTTAITNGTTGRVLYDNAGVLGEYTAVPVAFGGTNATSASITAFNNITGYTATGATGTTSTNLVFSTSPSITTPTFVTSATGPLFIGGTGTTSTLTLRSTSGVGTTGADIIFQTGNNGATEAMRVLNSGNILISTVNTPSNKDTVTPKVVITGSGASGSAQIVRHTTVGGGGGILEVSSTRGTDVNSYTILQDGDGVGSIVFSGADGNEFTPAASVQCQVDGTPGDNDMPGRLIFSTTADGGSSATERARINSSGNLLLGGTAARGTTAGSAHLDIFDGTAPVGTLTNGISLYSSSGDFHFMDAAGSAYKVGYRNIPQNAQTSAYVAAVTDVGKHISITTGGVTVNASVFSAGDVFTIYNNSGSSQNITAGSGVTFRLAGTATSGTPRTVAQYGLATVLCVTGGASPVFVLSGAGVA